MARSDLFLIQMIKTLHDNVQDIDPNSYDNTVVQFFEAPHITATLSVSVLPVTTDPTAFVWGNASTASNGYWGYGASWK